MSLARRRKLVLYANLSDAFAAVIYAWAIFSGGMFTIQPGGSTLLNTLVYFRLQKKRFVVHAPAQNP